MTQPIRPCRSALYLPASNPRAIEKARGLPCDAVILDLEDAVAPEAKVEARAAAVLAFDTGGFGERLTVLRVNALDTAWGEADLVAAASLGIDAVLAPKIETAADVARYRERLGGQKLWVMIETARAVANLQPIADAVGAGGALVIGTNDLALEMRCAGRAPLLPILTLAVAAARASGLAVLDGVRNDFSDVEAFLAEAEQGRDMGFDGKTLIHPAQIMACNGVFTPSADQVARARAIVAAFDLPEHAGEGAIRLDGRMVERLHLNEAQRTLALFAAANSAYAGAKQD
ncbi:MULTISPECIES: HpcH/HpaI aldolase/citrate lyase family protein [Sphingomonas]|uniref:HpcH/HpaI aldolase/citrate lyase family protein n=1 Tax=Sphingomonas TaxID=13687 RepID=UPI0008365A95|nr:CoA ester lyase [Sphingomonas sp. CCH10-B3]